MSFLHSAFTENSREAREWLESIGYAPFDMDGKKRSLIGTYQDGIYSFCSDRFGIDRKTGKRKDYIVDCRGNFPLFKAISAMRDDSDYMQYFTFNGEFELNLHNGIVEDMNPVHKSRIQTIGRKASLPELINHFKRRTKNDRQSII